MRRFGLNALGILFGILSILIVITVAAILLGKVPFRMPFGFNIDMRMERFKDMFSSNTIEEFGDEVFEGRYDTIDIENIAGEIYIEGWEEDYVFLEYKKMAPTEEHIHNLTIEIDDSGRTLEIDRQFEDSCISPRGKIDFKFFIPIDMIDEINAKSVSGNVSCAHMLPTIDQHLQTSSGNIETDACHDLTAKTISGEIHFTSFGDTVEIRSTSGRIEGDYRSTEGRGKIDIHTVSGSVRLELPDNFQGDVDLRSIKGPVDSEFPVQVTSSKRNSLEGKIGGGGVNVDINSTTGSIRIIKASGD